ncbi:hypothetical protein A2856_00215 [Candidatus Uhrbacteria bacterium RIFCSPHIGHO2_01_FULL_63_20]|uniref:Uncharacterized protein n=1 Tax=Candidatus Uhrbacteria bacterium RIFCSPHIGHO2_01_FULL_63_20 TaxID=1802385 RepID=A0A1F7TN16_9BACT|nr:MAG: hypothetical protein A2856_00215 [Candidatus Uhrbacteria bacterium RIFCSPHIGHO2_01_FULL_63_20]
MGGVNHQPCGKPLPYSTEMSKRLSLAHIGIEIANVALEDVLLSELAGRTTNVRPFENALVAAHAQIDDFQESVRILIDVLKADKYQELETLEQMDRGKTGGFLSCWWDYG